MNKRSQGSAHRGLGEWVLQRLSAIYIGGFGLYVAIRLVVAPIRDYPAWVSWMHSGTTRAAFALFFLTTFIHVWIGLRSVYMDYLRIDWLRFLISALTAVGLLVMAFWVMPLLFGGRL